MPALQQHAKALPRPLHTGAALLTAPSCRQSSGTSSRAARLAGSTRRAHPKQRLGGKGSSFPSPAVAGIQRGDLWWSLCMQRCRTLQEERSTR